MWPAVVVVVLVLGQHHCGVSLVDDQGAVEEFAADAADEAFGDRVGPRRAHGVLMMRMSVAVKTASKAVVNWASRSRRGTGSGGRRRRGR